MALDARHYATDALLRDGGSVHVRAIRPDDRQRLLDLFAHLSARSAYFRFFRTKTTLTPEELSAFIDLDFVHNVTLVATLREHDAEHIVAAGHYLYLPTSPPAPARAEVAFAVADAHQGRGLGTLLLTHLAAIAREHGIDEFEADVLGENNRMLAVFVSSVPWRPGCFMSPSLPRQPHKCALPKVSENGKLRPRAYGCFFIPNLWP